MQLLLLGIAVVGWSVVHSVLASMWIKAFVRRLFGADVSRGYRLAYNVFAAISLAPAAWLMWRLPDRDMYSVPAPWSTLMLVGQGVAAALTALTLLQTNALHFAGLSQILGQSDSSELVSSGFYRIVRHPLYLFGLIVLWFSPHMTVNRLVVSLIFTAYLFIGAILEERRLEAEFGEAYRAYRRKTPMMFPFLWPPR